MGSQTEAFSASTFAYCYFHPRENEEPLLPRLPRLPLLLDVCSPRRRRRKGMGNLAWRRNGLVDAAIIAVVRRGFIDVHFSSIAGKCACEMLPERSSAAKHIQTRRLWKEGNKPRMTYSLLFHLFPSFARSLRGKGHHVPADHRQYCGGADMSAKKLHVLCLGVCLPIPA